MSERMKIELTEPMDGGWYDGTQWRSYPDTGVPFDVTPEMGADLCASGRAKPVRQRTSSSAETRPAPESAEKRDTPKAETKPEPPKPEPPKPESPKPEPARPEPQRPGTARK